VRVAPLAPSGLGYKAAYIKSTMTAELRLAGSATGLDGPHLRSALSATDPMQRLPSASSDTTSPSNQ
jgi:hypothetical protein